MQVSKVDFIVIIVIAAVVFGFLLHGCSTNNAVASEEMYKKCVEVDGNDSTVCDQEFVIF